MGDKCSVLVIVLLGQRWPAWLAQDLIRRVAEDEERIMRLARDPVGVRLAWLLVRLARLGDVVEDDGWLGLPVSLNRKDLALWGVLPPPGDRSALAHRPT